MKKEYLPAVLYFAILMSAVFAGAFYMSGKFCFPGPDAVGTSGIIEQMYRGIKQGDYKITDALLMKPMLFKDINYPAMLKWQVNLDEQIQLIFRLLTGTESGSFNGALFFHLAMNIFAVFLILRYMFRLNMVFSLFFSVISSAFPHFYFRAQHLSLAAFWQQLLFLYFCVKFIQRPSLKYTAGVVLGFFLVLSINIQQLYLFVLAAAPALIILFAAVNTKNKRGMNYYVSLFACTLITVILCSLIFVITMRSKLSDRQEVFDFNGQNVVIKKYLPVRDPGEINVWKAPLLHFILPPGENILFGKITKRKFESTWGFHEKAVYPGLFMGLIAAIMIVYLIRKKGLREFTDNFIETEQARLFYGAAVLTVAISLFIMLMPTLKMGFILYKISSAARVYTRLMTLALPLWTIIIALSASYLIKKMPGIPKAAVGLFMLLIALDTFPATLKPITFCIEKTPIEYEVLNKNSVPGEILIDYFGRYGGYLEYGYIQYARMHKMKSLHPALFDKKWGKELNDAINAYGVKKILFYKNKKCNIDKFIKEYGYKIIYKNNRSIIAAVE